MAEERTSSSMPRPTHSARAAEPIFALLQIERVWVDAMKRATKCADLGADVAGQPSGRPAHCGTGARRLVGRLKPSGAVRQCLPFPVFGSGLLPCGSLDTEKLEIVSSRNFLRLGHMVSHADGSNWMRGDHFGAR